VETEDGRRIGNNDELEKLMRGENIVTYTRAHRIKWWEHLKRMEDTKKVTKITEWSPTGVSSKGLPK
jgi:uncharacterized membrane protein